METLDYYKIIRNSVQLLDVKLEHLECNNYGYKRGEKPEINLKIQRKTKIMNEKQVKISLQVVLDFEENAPFHFKVIYSGVCEAMKELEEEEFEQYAYEQVVPLLLPYVRECITNTLSRMKLPIFYLPTIDVLETIKVNSSHQE
ncbi:protein-export chaperone SecB [Bacillus paramycoides]|uniref:protein-export chaperone SecB n=1 Tax=Bacillus paramycoides TaxID=2026194 RepID=UPI003B64BB5A